MIQINFPLEKEFQNKNKIVFNKPINSQNNKPLDQIILKPGFLYTLYGINGIGNSARP